MSLGARIIGLGQPAAGDDGVGNAVLSLLREESLPEGVELLEVAEATGLYPLLQTTKRVILVDAIVGALPGEVLVLSPEALAERGARALSSHGVEVLSMIELARLLEPETLSPEIRIVGVGIQAPQGVGYGLSLEVSSALPRAASAVRALIGG